MGAHLGYQVHLEILVLQPMDIQLCITEEELDDFPEIVEQSQQLDGSQQPLQPVSLKQIIAQPLEGFSEVEQSQQPVNRQPLQPVNRKPATQPVGPRKLVTQPVGPRKLATQPVGPRKLATQPVGPRKPTTQPVGPRKPANSTSRPQKASNLTSRPQKLANSTSRP